MNSTTLETTTITVKHITPPKAHGKPGSVKDGANQFFGVWPDKLSMFQVGETYEIAYNTNNGYRNIVGMPKKVSVEPLRGEFTQVAPTSRSAAPRTQEHQIPQATQQESIFVCGGLYRDIEMGRVGTTEDELVERTILWRNVYRRAFPE